MGDVPSDERIINTTPSVQKIQAYDKYRIPDDPISHNYIFIVLSFLPR